jgi:hypothetical protein
MNKSDLPWYKNLFIYMLIPLIISLFSALIGLLFPIGFIVSGITIYIFFLYISILLFFIKEIGEKKGDEIDSSKKIKSWKRWLRYWSIPFILFGIIFMISFLKELNEPALGISILGFGFLTLGLFMIFTSLRKYETRPTEPSSRYQ